MTEQVSFHFLLAIDASWEDIVLGRIVLSVFKRVSSHYFVPPPFVYEVRDLRATQVVRDGVFSTFVNEEHVI
jgi:hypothetical protein